MSKLRGAAKQALEAKSIAGILLREHDNVDQAINYAERMAQRCANSRSLMAMEYQDAAKELKSWKQKQTPLIELLVRVPQDARLIVEHDQHSSSSYPVGRLCHEAASLERQE